MFSPDIHQPPATFHSERTLDALPKVLSSSPADRMTTPPIGEVLHLPGMRQVSHNKQQSSVGSCRHPSQSVFLFCFVFSFYWKKKTKCSSAPPARRPAFKYRADTNPRGTHCTTVSGPAFSIFRKINEQAHSKTIPCIISHFQSNPQGFPAITSDTKWVILLQKLRWDNLLQYIAIKTLEYE